MITGMPRIAIAAWDFTALVRRFRDDLGMPVIDLSDFSRREYGADLAMCVPKGGSNIELMSPANPEAPLSKSLQGFLERRGEGLFALMLEAPEPDEEAETLAARGIRILPPMPGAFGRDLHPSSTHGVLIRIYPVNSFENRHQPDRSDTTFALSGIDRVMIAVGDLQNASAVYGATLGLNPALPTDHEPPGVQHVRYRAGSGGAIELVAVQDAHQGLGRTIAEHLQTDREGMFALVLQTPDVTATARHLSNRGIRTGTAEDNPRVLAIDPVDTFGARLRIEEAIGD